MFLYALDKDNNDFLYVTKAQSASSLSFYFITISTTTTTDQFTRRHLLQLNRNELLLLLWIILFNSLEANVNDIYLQTQ